jgi:hypothetical protein
VTLGVFALTNGARSHNVRFLTAYYSNCVTNSVNARLHCTLRARLSTAYVMILLVPLFSHNDIYAIFLLFLKTHMAVRLLELLVSNGHAVTFTRHMLLLPIFLLCLRSGRFYKWYWVVRAQTFRTTVRYPTNTCYRTNPVSKPDYISGHNSL